MQFSHLEVNKNKEVQWKTDVNKWQMFILAVPLSCTQSPAPFMPHDEDIEEHYHTILTLA